MVSTDFVLDQATLASRRRKNAWQSIGLLALLLCLLGLSGWAVAGALGVLALVFGGAFVLLLGPRIGAETTLRIVGAQPIAEIQAPQLTQALRTLAARSGLARPSRLWYLSTSAINAFSVGSRDNSAIVITAGLLNSLNGRELAGVLAHEVSHVAGNDMHLMALADMATRMTGTIGRIGLLLAILYFPVYQMGAPTPSLYLILVLVFSPPASALVQLALSRTREFEADANAAKLTGDPLGLASALTRMARLGGDTWERLFMPGRRAPELSVLRTHPSTKERVRRLAELAEARISQPLTALPDLAAEPLRGFPASRRPRWRIGGWW